MKNTSTALHFGPPPITPAVHDQIVRVHRLGFRTTLMPTYERLSGLGLDPDDYDAVLQPIEICDLC